MAAVCFDPLWRLWELLSWFEYMHWEVCSTL